MWRDDTDYDTAPGDDIFADSVLALLEEEQIELEVYYTSAALAIV